VFHWIVQKFGVKGERCVSERYSKQDDRDYTLTNIRMK